MINTENYHYYLNQQHCHDLIRMKQRINLIRLAQANRSAEGAHRPRRLHWAGAAVHGILAVVFSIK